MAEYLYRKFRKCQEFSDKKKCVLILRVPAVSVLDLCISAVNELEKKGSSKSCGNSGSCVSPADGVIAYAGETRLQCHSARFDQDDGCAGKSPTSSHLQLILWCCTACLDFLALGAEARILIGFRPAA
jgi:hypothetical protein